MHNNGGAVLTLGGPEMNKGNTGAQSVITSGRLYDNGKRVVGQKREVG